jgi:hypothetical protein
MIQAENSNTIAIMPWSRTSKAIVDHSKNEVCTEEDLLYDELAKLRKIRP